MVMSRQCRAAEEDRQRLAMLQRELEEAATARDAWQRSHAALDAQHMSISADADATHKEAAALRATNGQLDQEIAQLRSDAAAREAALAEARRGGGEAAAAAKEQEAAAAVARDRLRSTEAQLRSAEEAAGRLQAEHAELKAKCAQPVEMHAL